MRNQTLFDFGKRAFVGIRVILIKILRNAIAENGVPEKFEPFVILKRRMLVRIRSVSKTLAKQVFILERKTDYLFAGGYVEYHTLSPLNAAISSEIFSETSNEEHS